MNTNRAQQRSKKQTRLVCFRLFEKVFFDLGLVSVPKLGEVEDGSGEQVRDWILLSLDSKKLDVALHLVLHPLVQLRAHLLILQLFFGVVVRTAESNSHSLIRAFVVTVCS